MFSLHNTKCNWPAWLRIAQIWRYIVTHYLLSIQQRWWCSWYISTRSDIIWFTFCSHDANFLHAELFHFQNSVLNSGRVLFTVTSISIIHLSWNYPKTWQGYFVQNFKMVEQRRTFNPLRPSDAIWRHRSGSALFHVMACCLMAPSHYLNQCWLIIRKV